MKTTEQKGFTLLEIVVCIAVATIVTVVVGKGLVEMASGYIFAKKNVLITQHGQIAMTRLKKEFSHNIHSVNSASATSITFVRISDYVLGDTTPHTISWAGGSSPLLWDGDTLIGELSAPVTSFNLNYYDSYSSSASPSYSGSTSIIEISLQLSGAENTTIQLTDRVNLWLATGA